jgi:fucose 4-O-acetylase-like acetyltransferase
VPRCEALDWMKAIGISLIVYGHVAHATTVAWVPPIYVKQFGVAFFLFAAAFTLSRERRAPLDAVLSRLMPVYLFGLATAAVVTAAGVVFGTGLALSNYLPFMAGANVAFNNFPANPTTWYLGTYVHALLLWACFFSRRRLGAGAIAVALAIEIPARIALYDLAGPYVAYMALTNWLAVFIAGLVMGARPTIAVRRPAVSYLAGLAAVLVAVSVGLGAFNPVPEFPFMILAGGSGLGLVAFSLLVSALYMSATLLVFKATEHAVAPAAVRFLARNSLIIVLVHMPVFIALNPVLARLGWSYAARVAFEVVLCLPVLAWFSEVVTAAVSPKAIGARVADFIAMRAHRAFAGRHVPFLEPR